jgi:hypothetical protein
MLTQLAQYGKTAHKINPELCELSVSFVLLSEFDIRQHKGSYGWYGVRSVYNKGKTLPPLAGVGLMIVL